MPSTRASSHQAINRHNRLDARPQPGTPGRHESHDRDAHDSDARIHASGVRRDDSRARPPTKRWRRGGLSTGRNRSHRPSSASPARQHRRPQECDRSTSEQPDREARHAGAARATARTTRIPPAAPPRTCGKRVPASRSQRSPDPRIRLAVALERHNPGKSSRCDLATEMNLHSIEGLGNGTSSCALCTSTRGTPSPSARLKR